MAEALKTFREGEDILASETNENNQFLLSKLSDNAAQVQQYVEGEVATIKSNVSSVQATLQNNIDELAALIKGIKSYVVETKEGINGYRIFSDGYVQQWGFIDSTREEGAYTINLEIPMLNLDYQVLASNGGRAQVMGDWDFGTVGAKVLTESSIQVYRGRGGGSISWFVHGKKRTTEN
jgi:hypothetical protein